MQDNLKGINLGRYIAALLVIAVHAYTIEPIKSVSAFLVVNGIARVAVPFFFCCTGYFITLKGIEDRKVVYAYIKKNLGIYMKLSLIYVPVSFLGLFGMGKMNIQNVLIYLQEFIVKGSFLHLWYFPAVIGAVFLLHLLQRRLSVLNIGIITAIIYTFGLLGDSYYGVVKYLPDWFGYGMDIYDSIFITTRNGIFFGLPMVFLGFLICRFKEKLQGINLVPVLTISIVGLVMEVMFLRNFGFSRDYNLLVSIVPITSVVFCMILNWKHEPIVDTDKLKRQSEFFYKWHPILVGILIVAMNILRGSILEYGLIRFLFVWMGMIIIWNIRELKGIYLKKQWRA